MPTGVFDLHDHINIGNDADAVLRPVPFSDAATMEGR